MNFLDNVPDQNAFYLCNGAKIMNLEELLMAIRNSDDAVFYNHVTPDKNDFANWITAIIHHDELVKKLIQIKDRKEFLLILDQEIEMLKNPKIRETAKFFKESTEEHKVGNVGNRGNVDNVAVNSATINASQNIVSHIPSAPSSTSNPAETSASNSKKIAAIAEMFKEDAVPMPMIDDSKSKMTSDSITQSVSDVDKPEPAEAEVFEYEEIFSTLIAEIEQEITAWDG